MNKLSCCLFLFLLTVATRANAQQDTTGDKGWSNMPVVSDSALAAQQKADSAKVALTATADSVKKATAEALKNEVDEKEFIRTQLKALCSKGMAGRGYVKGGWDSAAKYILKKFKEYKLQPVVPGGPYAQGFAFPVNTFPGKMTLFINGDSLVPGKDFIIDAASSSYTMDSGQRLPVRKLNVGKIKDTAAWMAKLSTLDSSHAYYLTNLDALSERLELRKDQLIAQLPSRCFIIPEDGKLTWTVHREPIPATVFYVQKDSIGKRVKHISVNVNAVYVPHQRSENIIACMPGEVRDSYVVFTAHYDHLGMMGSKTIFQGASDNASGTSMLLYLASYFSRHPQHYSILFIAFGAEEASLMGSEFFVWHPFVPLKNIKFLTNIDIMGDATNGITVVNASENVNQFNLLERINEKEKYLRIVLPRDNAANSDHYYFTKTHVPAIFIYSNGGQGYYHDVYDVRTALSLNHIEGVARLLIDFTEQLKDLPPNPVAAASTVPEKPVTEPSGFTAPPADNPAPPAEGTIPPKEEEPSPKPQETPEKQ